MTLYEFTQTRKSAYFIRYCMAFPLGNKEFFTTEVKQYCLKVAGDFCREREIHVIRSYFTEDGMILLFEPAEPVQIDLSDFAKRLKSSLSKAYKEKDTWGNGYFLTTLGCTPEEAEDLFHEWRREKQ